MKTELQYCRACGHEIAHSAKRCPNCGAKQKRHHPIVTLLIVLIIVPILAFSAIIITGITSDTVRYANKQSSSSYSYSSSVQDDTHSTTSNNKRPTESKATQPTESDSGESETTLPAESDSNTIRPEFKKMMDEYEDFFESYCDFMEEYQKDPTNLSLLTKYATIMTEYAEMVESLDNVDTDNLSNAELAYYLEVTARIEKMLLSAVYA